MNTPATQKELPEPKPRTATGRCGCSRVATVRRQNQWVCDECIRIEGDHLLTGGPETGERSFYERLSRRAKRRISPGTAKFAGVFNVGI